VTTNWQQAACRDHNLELWFPGKNGNGCEAKRICRTCPLRAACLEDAINSGDTYAGIRGGIRGGKSAEDRRRIAAARKRVEPDRSADIIRLHRKRWSTKSIAIRYGINVDVVCRVLRAHREAQAGAA
jgi:WhiB family redox-sensing transcriptional regulator